MSLSGLALSLALSAGAMAADPGSGITIQIEVGETIVDSELARLQAEQAELEVEQAEELAELEADLLEDDADLREELIEEGLLDAHEPMPTNAAGFGRAAVERISALEARLEEMEAELAAQEDRERRERADTGTPVDAVASNGGILVEAGDVVEDAVSLAGPVDVRGTVLGDAVAMGGGIVVHDGARVHGDAVAFGGPVEVRPGGRVDGDKVAMGGTPSMTAVMGPVAEIGDGWMAAVRGLLRRLAMVLSIAGAGVLVVGLWPRQVNQVAEMVRARPFWSSIAGGILVAAFSVGALALTFTFIGIPLALLLVGVLALAGMLGFVAVCQALGENIPQLRQHGSWATFLAGAALLGLVSLFPWVGPLTLTLIGFSAVGAALVTRLGNSMAVEPA